MYLDGSKLPSVNSWIASGNGPHLEPTMVSSCTTKPEVSMVALAAQVLLRTIVPIGTVIAAAIFKPSTVPAASTTTSKLPLTSSGSSSAVCGACKNVAADSPSKAAFSTCRPIRVIFSWRFCLIKTSAISNPSLPSPKTQTLSVGLIRFCSTILQAAAKGSTKAASSTGTLGGTTWRFTTGSVRYSAYVPSWLMIPSTRLLRQ
mmetsp:Transcript_75253/g.156765  ORF Transcript_75253/g.156765 Transcript_75253/m.156765 type:complete len:203 (+) Transcript_75253:235-843(+)